MYDNVEGVWRTVGGRRIFIKDGEDLETAMRNSGKFADLVASKAKRRWEELIKDNPNYDKEFDRIEIHGNIFEDEGSGRYKDTTQTELNKMPVALKLFSQYGNTCYIYKNKGALLKDVEQGYGGFKQLTDNGSARYSISSKSGIGEYYLVRDDFAKGGWVWKDVNDDTVQGYEYAKKFKKD